MISWKVGLILGLYCQHICIRLCILSAQFSGRSR
uniref:Uncharacterized protein n=1 Tax=Anguilla anguilla TaxID=7936 RepID=A0A0E9UQH2_ANGAN